MCELPNSTMSRKRKCYGKVKRRRRNHGQFGYFLPNLCLFCLAPQRQVLVVLYQEWFRVSSQKDSQADTVTLYLRQVALTTPTLLPYVVNLTDGNGNMALHYSVSHSNFPVVRLLLDTGRMRIKKKSNNLHYFVFLAHENVSIFYSPDRFVRDG